MVLYGCPSMLMAADVAVSIAVTAPSLADSETQDRGPVAAIAPAPGLRAPQSAIVTACPDRFGVKARRSCSASIAETVGCHPFMRSLV